MKIGRNAPCHCGSGKKYKKCCLLKDEEERARPRIEAYEECPPDTREEPDVGAFTWMGAQGFNVACEERDDKSGDIWHPNIDAPLPSLSEAEQKVVDEWWDAVKPLFEKEDGDEMSRRVLEFNEAHPELFEHLYLHQELLFELGAMLGRQGKPERYAELLMRLRREQPGMYKRSFGYYDRDVIMELVVKKGHERKPEDYTKLHGAFLRFLQNDRGLPWLSARFLADRLSSFWCGYSRRGHAGDLLYPSAEEVEKYLVRSCRHFFYIDGVALLSALQALALFGSFLGNAGIYSESEEESRDAEIAALYERGRGSVEPDDCAYRIYPSYESLRRAEGVG